MLINNALLEEYSFSYEMYILRPLLLLNILKARSFSNHLYWINFFFQSRDFALKTNDVVLRRLDASRSEGSSLASEPARRGAARCLVALRRRALRRLSGE